MASLGGMAVAPVDVKITGVHEVDAALAAMPAVLRDKYLDAACAAAVRNVVKPAVLAKVRRGKTGNLARGVRVKKRRRRKGEDIVGWRVVSGPPAYHAHLLEFGTRQRFTSRGFNRGRVPKKKFAYLRKSLYDNEKDVRLGFMLALKVFIRNASREAKFAKRAINAVMPEYSVRIPRTRRNK